MRPVTGVVLTAILLTASIQFWINADEFDEWLIERVTNTPEEPPITPMQSIERWPIILVDFDSNQLSSQAARSKADGILTGTYSLENYFDQISAGSTKTELDFNNDVIRAQHSYAWYGKDSDGKRDVGNEEGHGPATLAFEAISQSNLNWEDFDLNSDGWVDRVLILHSAPPQEDGSGATNRIWSHHGPLAEQLELGGGLKVSHYTMASLSSENYRGTVYHEMLHQFGSPDLYPVHNDLAGDPWKGVGDWDVMASGNWNDNGRVPALPTSAVLQVIGIERFNDMLLEWDSDSNWCAGPQIEMKGTSLGGSALRIEINDDEFILIEARYDSGFDTGLPGHGILVTQLDLKAGDIRDNEVNSDSTRPWLKVIEADGRQDLINSNSEGEASDVFVDGSRFGRSGVEIRDRSGILVDWQANVSGTPGNYSLTFGSENCGYKGFVKLPDYGSLSIAGENASVTMELEDCTPVIDLTVDDGSTVILENNLLILDPNNAKSSKIISGTIDCAEGGLSRDIEHSFQIVGNIPIDGQIITGDIYAFKPMSYEIFIQFEGSGSHEWNMMLDGPLSRIGQIDSKQTLEPGEGIRIDIEPAGLLTEGMLAKGVLIIADDSGHRWEVELELRATENPEELGLLDQIRRPGAVIAIGLFALTIWVIFETRWSSAPRDGTTDLDKVESGIYADHTNPLLIDPFSESD